MTTDDRYKVETFGEFAIFIEDGWYTIEALEELLVGMKEARDRQNKAMEQAMRIVK